MDDAPDPGEECRVWYVVLLSGVTEEDSESYRKRGVSEGGTGAVLPSSGVTIT